MMSAAPHILLIHGSWHGGWIWERLLPLLGGRASAFDLPGPTTHDPQQLDRITLGDWVTAVVAAGEALAGELVLVAHSMGALTLPAAAARLGSRVRHVVYLAGLAPAERRCAADQFMPALPFSVGPFGKAPPGGTLPPRQALRHMLCGDLDEATCAWLLERVRPTPTRPALTRISWRSLRWPCPITYVTTTRDRAVSPAVQRRALASLPAARVVPFDCGHELMLSRPQELAELLLGI